MTANIWLALAVASLFAAAAWVASRTWRRQLLCRHFGHRTEYKHPQQWMSYCLRCKTMQAREIDWGKDQW